MLNTVYIGIGQCGNRFADCFAKGSTEGKAGLKGAAGIAAIAINTAAGDMSMLENIRDENKIKITLSGRTEGAGRNPQVGQESMESNLELVDSCIISAAKKAQMDHIDLCFLWAGLGGGTGTGGLQVLAEHLAEEGYNIAIGVTMPRKNEGMVARCNAYNAMLDLQDWLSKKGRRDIPYIVIDNNKISDMTLERSNEIIASSIMRLNKATSYELAGSNFDNSDFLSVLKRYGTMSVVRASVPVAELNGSSSKAILSALQKETESLPFTESIAADARGAAVIAVVPKKFLATGGGANRKVLDENLNEVTGTLRESNPYSAIYLHPSEENMDKIYVYALLTGLASPQKEMAELGEEVEELIVKDKEIVKRNRKAFSGMKKLSLYDDDDDDDEEGDDSVETGSRRAVGHYNFGT